MELDIFLTSCLHNWTLLSPPELKLRDACAANSHTARHLRRHRQLCRDDTILAKVYGLANALSTNGEAPAGDVLVALRTPCVFVHPDAAERWRSHRGDARIVFANMGSRYLVGVGQHVSPHPT